MADGAKSLAKAMEAMFHGHAVEEKTSIKQNRRSLNLIKDKEDEVVRVRLSPAPASMEARTADAVFACRSKTQPSLLVVIVELKGSDVSHALTQIEQTAERFCKASCASHGAGLAAGHNGLVLGVFSCRQGRQNQVESKKLRKKGIVLIHCKEYDLKVCELRARIQKSSPKKA